MPSSKIKTPRPYFSYRQFSIVERDPELYREIYFGEGTQYDNEAMEFGRGVHNAIAKREETGNVEIDHAKMVLPAYPKQHYDVKAKIPGGIILMGQFDGFDPQKMILVDYKTGMTKWTQKMVDGSDQLTFYAYICAMKYKKPLSAIKLHWYNREEKDVTTFQTTRSKIDMMRLHPRIQKAWNVVLEISEEESKTQ